MKKLPLFEVKNAPGCAWRALYLYRRVTCRHYGHQFMQQCARIVLDPSAGRPSLSGRLFAWQFRVAIPFMGWSANQSRIKSRWQNFIHSLDGRLVSKK